MNEGAFFDIKTYRGLFFLSIYMSAIFIAAWYYPEFRDFSSTKSYNWRIYVSILIFFTSIGLLLGFLYLYLERNNPTLLKKFAPSVYKERIQGLENESSITRPGEQKISSEKNE